MRPADDFPQDDSGYGFDNIGDVLSLSPALMEKYLSAADRVARAARVRNPGDDPDAHAASFGGRRNGDARTFPAQYDRTGLSLPNAFHAMHRVPVEADYIIRVGLGGARPAGSDPITLTLWVDDKQVDSLVYDAEKAASFDQDRQDFNANTRQFRVRLPAGEHRSPSRSRTSTTDFPPSSAAQSGEAPAAAPARVFTPRPGATPEQIARQRKQFESLRPQSRSCPSTACA